MTTKLRLREAPNARQYDSYGHRDRLHGASIGVQAADPRHFSFAYDQPHTTAYGIAADTFTNKLQELSKGTIIIDQFPGAQLGQEPPVLPDVVLWLPKHLFPESVGCFKNPSGAGYICP